LSQWRAHALRAAEQDRLVPSPLARLVVWLAPPLCAACGGWAGTLEPLCGPCRATLRWLGPGVATARGVPVWAPLAYEGAARELVRALKFGGARRAAPAMAAQIAANAPDGLLGGGGTLVPVPVHPARARRRGYDHAGLLATALAERTALAAEACLERAGRDVPQVGRGRAARLTGPVGELRVRGGVRAPARALLVDDVVTTGATLGACAAALRSGGSREVVAVAYARTPAR
jgi:predicted amidophosphoribosyltransferase